MGCRGHPRRNGGARDIATRAASLPVYPFGLIALRRGMPARAFVLGCCISIASAYAGPTAIVLHRPAPHRFARLLVPDIAFPALEVPRVSRIARPQPVRLPALPVRRHVRRVVRRVPAQSPLAAPLSLGYLAQPVLKPRL